MPCRDWGDENCDSYREDIHKLQKKVDDLTRMLCTILGDKRNTEKGIWTPTEAMEWYWKHKEQDRKRRKYEAEEREYNKRLKEWEAKRPKR
jgi:hypothetical protein